MQCPRCYSKFKYISIPMENRIYEAGSARFICPCGRVWLKPRRKFAFLSVLGLLAIAVPVVIGSFGRIFGFHLTVKTI